MKNSVKIKNQEFIINATEEQIALFNQCYNRMEWKESFKHVTVKTRKIAPGTVVEIVKVKRVKGYKGGWELKISVKPVDGGDVIVLSGWNSLIQLEYPSVEVLKEAIRIRDEENRRRWSDMQFLLVCFESTPKKEKKMNIDTLAFETEDALAREVIMGNHPLAKQYLRDIEEHRDEQYNKMRIAKMSKMLVELWDKIFEVNRLKANYVSEVNDLYRNNILNEEQWKVLKDVNE